MTKAQITILCLTAVLLALGFRMRSQTAIMRQRLAHFARLDPDSDPRREIVNLNREAQSATRFHNMAVASYVRADPNLIGLVSKQPSDSQSPSTTNAFAVPEGFDVHDALRQTIDANSIKLLSQTVILRNTRFPKRSWFARVLSTRGWPLALGGLNR